MKTIVGVVGAGTMGAGIAQVAALAGHPTLIYDTEPDRSKQAVADVTATLGRLAERSRLAAAEAAAAAERLSVVESLDRLAPCHLVIEAVIESLDVKRSVLGALSHAVDRDAILATNTSSLSIDAIAGGLPEDRRGGVVGMHFFNPAPVMRLVEVVRGWATDQAVVEEVCALAEAWGKVAIRVASSPGFVVNRVARPFYGEAHRLVEEGAADPAVIDEVMRTAAGFRMGPFELTNLIGQDVNYAVSTSVWEATGHDPRYAPSAYQRTLVESGRLGRKTGHTTAPTITHEGSPPAIGSLQGSHQPPSFRSSGTSILVAEPGLLAPLVQRIHAAGIAVEKSDDSPAGIRLPSGGLVRMTDGRHATTLASQLGRPVVLLDLALDYASISTLAVAPSDGCPSEVLAEASRLLADFGVTAVVIDDAPGLIVMRTVTRLVNEAIDLVGRKIVTAGDVDLAMLHGANYPVGPLAWGDRLGASTVLTVLDHMEDIYRDGRYRPSPSLRRHAASGRSLT